MVLVRQMGCHDFLTRVGVVVNVRNWDYAGLGFDSWSCMQFFI